MTWGREDEEVDERTSSVIPLGPLSSSASSSSYRDTEAEWGGGSGALVYVSLNVFRLRAYSSTQTMCH